MHRFYNILYESINSKINLFENMTMISITGGKNDKLIDESLTLIKLNLP